MSNEIVPFQERMGALSVVDVRAQVNLIQEVMREVMQEGEHFGVIPGTGTKKVLLKAGAEKLCLVFRLDPQYEITEKQDGQHLTVVSRCVLYHIPTGQRFGSGMGSCSSRESKYAYRNASKRCPHCGVEAIIKGKEEFGGGWVCFKKKSGCGAKFVDADPAITSQASGRVQNEDIADQYNTVLKMANKRSLVAGILNVTAASDIFTQDIEDLPAEQAEPVQPVEKAAPRRASRRPAETIDADTGEIKPRNPVGDLPADKLEQTFTGIDPIRAEDAKALDACRRLDTLQEEFGERYTAAKGDNVRRIALKSVYDDCKAKLTPAVDPFVADMEKAEAHANNR